MELDGICKRAREWSASFISFTTTVSLRTVHSTHSQAKQLNSGDTPIKNLLIIHNLHTQDNSFTIPQRKLLHQK